MGKGRVVPGLYGQIRGRLTILEPGRVEYKVGKNYSRYAYFWKCQCSCGNEVEVREKDLRYGSTKSCGCLKGENLVEVSTTHGMSGTPTHKIWAGVRGRCYCESNTMYPDYGGSGITMCDRWLEPEGKGFLNFLEDMGERPEGMSLNRIRCANVYSPETCEWATNSMQGYDKKHCKSNKSGKVGVRQAPSGRWTATIRYLENIYLGTFDTFEEAVKAREEAEIRFYGFSLDKVEIPYNK